MHGHQDLRETLNQTSLIDGHEQPDEERAVAQRPSLGQFLVEFGVELRQPFVDIAVEHQRKDRRHGIHRRVPNQQPVLVERDGLESTRDAEHGLAHADDQAAMDDELGEFGASLVAVSTVPHEQLGKVAELLDGEVGGETCLVTFFTDNANPHVRGLDHRYVVAAVADAADAFFCLEPDQLRHVGFLCW